MYHWSSFLEKISQVMLVMEMHFKELNIPENKIKNPLKQRARPYLIISTTKKKMLQHWLQNQLKTISKRQRKWGESNILAYANI